MNYETLLREHHLKVTPQRLSILSIMHDKGHISIEELFSHIKKKFTSISLATLYKNVNAMLENKLISEVKIPHNKSKYELSKTEHMHMVCTQCESVTDIHINVHELLEQVKDQSHYKIENYSVIFSGICEACQNK